MRMTSTHTARFVIVTPAFNEGTQIEETARSVLAQTVQPLRWVIVDDGSTDGTADVVRSLQARFPWIVYQSRRKEPQQAYFASNVYAIMAGVTSVRDLAYEFLAVLDADITLPPDYYEQILARFDADPGLGAASGIFDDLVDGRLQSVLHDRRTTPKSMQVFRRACFEQIGGYLPLKYGAEDTCSCVMARMKGWKTWSFPELKAIHRRPMGLGHSRNMRRARFHQGLCEYALATHPLFMIAKQLRRCLLERPLLIGGALRLAGYAYGYLRHEPRQMPPDVIKYLRQEQVARVFRFNRIPLHIRPAADVRV
jgi:poly-beta-1,6-N-acetyl-D-glucosamine synthase